MNLLAIRDLSTEQINQILNRASFFLKSKTIPPSLENKFVAHLFFEQSTRTRFSFEIATHRLGAQPLIFDETFSSMKKGETIYDTLKMLEAMGVHAAVIRHSDENLWNDLLGRLNLSLINAGTGKKDHPTQALLDALTLQEHFGKVEGLTVAIIGDLLHSRVAHSNIECLGKLKAQVLLSGPAEWIIKEPLPAHVKKVSVDEAFSQADAVMMLRIQKERHTSSQTDQDYLQQFGLNENRLKRMKPHAVFMHPGPFNREVEIESSLVENSRSLIFKQVTHGVFIRMAVLEMCLKGPA